MAEFTYQAKTRAGETQNGSIEAASVDAALKILQQHNLIVLEIKPVSKRLYFWQTTSAVSSKYIVAFSRQLATLFGARVPLVEALKATSEQTEDPVFFEIIREIIKDVEGGMSLSGAISKHDEVFGSFYVNMIKAGEVSGKLEDSINYLADYVERQDFINQKAISALIYPVFVLISLLVFVVPSFANVLQQTGQPLPGITNVVINVSLAVRTYWYVFLAVFSVGLTALISYFRRSKFGRLNLDRIKLRLPIFGDVFKKIYLARLAESLSTLIVGGIPITQAIEITAKVVSNLVYENILNKAAEVVKGGGTISSVFKSSSAIPPMVSAMVSAGESSGRLDSSLKNVSNFYQKEVANVMDNIVSLIEPVLIIILGVGIGLLVVAIMLPMYNLTQSL